MPAHGRPFGQRKAKEFTYTMFDLNFKPVLNDKVLYHIRQLEKCPSTGREHYQCYVEFKNPVTNDWMKDVFLQGTGAHFEKRKGSRLQAAEYCMKKESQVKEPEEFGRRPGGQGTRSDLITVKEMLDNNVPIREVYQSHFETSARYWRFFDRYVESLQRPRTEMPIVRILWGRAGSGKTKFVYDNHKSVYVKDPTTVWWCDYNQQEAILFDDIEWHMIERTFFNTLCDIHPMRRQKKGGNVEINSKYIYFTSNYDPAGWIANDEAILRRIESIQHFI